MLLRFYQVFCIFLIMSCMVGCTTKRTVEVYQPTTVIERPAAETFNNTEVVRVLNELIQVDTDAYHSYSQAMKVLRNRNFNNSLAGFQLDHENHIRALSKLVVDLGGAPPVFAESFKGFGTPGYINITSSMRARTVLEALQTNSIINNRYYRKALSLYLPVYVKTLLQNHLADEVRHVQSIERMEDEIRG